MKTLTTILATLVILLTTLSATAQTTCSKSNEVRIELTYEDGLLNINWSTQKEVNSSYFLVEKSNDSLHFSSVKMIPAAGNSNFVRNYQYTETEANTGQMYYRVTLVTMNGQQIASVAIPLSTGNMGSIAGK